MSSSRICSLNLQLSTGLPVQGLNSEVAVAGTGQIMLPDILEVGWNQVSGERLSRLLKACLVVLTRPEVESAKEPLPSNQPRHHGSPGCLEPYNPVRQITSHYHVKQRVFFT